MAKILYGVAGEGLGHAVRSRVVIEHLRKNHKVRIVSAAKAYDYLSRFFKVEKIDYFKIVYRKNKAAYLLTFLNNLLRLPLIELRGLKILKIIKDFKPNIIITDFEPYVDYFAFFKKIPVLSIDNQHIIAKADYKNIPGKYKFDSFITKFIIKFFIIKANKYFINTFYNIKANKQNTFFIDPLLRKEIIKLKPNYKNHILVYQTSSSNRKLIEELKKINEKFIVYGFYESKNLGNVTLKDISEKEFLKDLESCKAVITNGGFTLITEALYLKKPILSIPIRKQYEQTLNAIYLERLGYGMFAKETSKEIIEKFIKNIPKYKHELKKYKKYNNKEALKKIDNAIKSLSRLK